MFPPSPSFQSKKTAFIFKKSAYCCDCDINTDALLLLSYQFSGVWKLFRTALTNLDNHNTTIRKYICLRTTEQNYKEI